MERSHKSEREADVNETPIALLLLAAGQSARFGAQKLSADLDGRMLCHHSAQRLVDLPFARRIAVVGGDDFALDQFGFEIVSVGASPPSLSRSIAAGMAALAHENIQDVMIALADMPFVPALHFANLIKQFDGDVLASCAGGINQPPAIFGARHFAQLQTLSGDTGARALLRDAPSVAADTHWLVDIDTAADLIAARERRSHVP